MPTQPPEYISFDDRIDGKQVNFRFTGQLPLKVREDRDGRLRIHDGRNEGWVDKYNFILVDDAPAYFSRYVQADPKDTWALGMRGSAWLLKGDYDNAIKDFDECIRLDPTNAGGFNERGNAYFAKKDYDRAINDYGEAIRLDPKDATGFAGRGSAYSDKRDYDRAIKDFDEAIRLDHKDPRAHFDRSIAQIATRRPGAVQGFQAVLDLEGYKGESATFAVILGHLAAEQAGDDAAAKRFLADSAGKLDAAWPEPAVRFLRGDLDEPGLLKLATDDDNRTEARCFLGLHHANHGRPAEALAHYRWVQQHGTPTSAEYGIAVAELDRLDAAAKPAKP